MKIAMFVEGQTEDIFIQKLLEKSTLLTAPCCTIIYSGTPVWISLSTPQIGQSMLANDYHIGIVLDTKSGEKNGLDKPECLYCRKISFITDRAENELWALLFGKHGEDWRKRN